MNSYPSYITPQSLNDFIVAALSEDIGSGDHTSLSSIPNYQQGKAQLIFKEEGIVAGIEMAKHIFQKVDRALQIESFTKDGNPIHNKEIGMIVTGNVHSILKSERLVLNCMQRMSGIATVCKKYIELIQHTKAKLLDTRKTTPNFRIAEKWAVAIGGGHNHRYGLFDMILLKDNHVDYAGGVAKAIQASKRYIEKNQLDLKIEVEVRNIEEVNEALNEGGFYRIMLDNMSIEEMKKAVTLINNKVLTEASGGVTLETIRKIAETGVDYISVGALTHSLKSLDISLKAYQ
ncbi:MAG: carboxylating nicotinate-nucleotide diphosphorylase [Cytophagales bacterium]|nr:MAG: carboxylating nicotinate-nucleotide diphosphorylase [Cytophagales bacterium]